MPKIAKINCEAIFLEVKFINIEILLFFMEIVHKNQNIKEFLHLLANSLPENANLDDVMYELYVKKKVDLGREQLKMGKGISLDDFKKKYNK